MRHLEIRTLKRVTSSIRARDVALPLGSPRRDSGDESFGTSMRDVDVDDVATSVSLLRAAQDPDDTDSLTVTPCSRPMYESGQRDMRLLRWMGLKRAEVRQLI